MLNFIKRLLGKPDSHGLRFSLKKLQEMRSEIAFLPIEEQAQYADEICRLGAEDLEWLEEQFSMMEPCDHTLFDCMNTTSIGNIAYLALHAPSPYNQKATRILNDAITYFHQ